MHDVASIAAASSNAAIVSRREANELAASTGGGFFGAVARSRSHQSLGIRSRLGGGTTTNSPSSDAGSGGSSAGCQPGSRSVAAISAGCHRAVHPDSSSADASIAEMGRKVVPALAGQNQRGTSNWSWS